MGVNGEGVSIHGMPSSSFMVRVMSLVGGGGCGLALRLLIIHLGQFSRLFDFN